LVISFDINDTLVCSPEIPTEPSVSRWRRPWYREELRRGAKGLMKELLGRQCRIWVYTTSYRSPRYLRGWFRCFGVPLAGVVNQSRHDRVVGRHGPSKYPPAFGINLHVDDSEGVGLEGRRYGFDVAVVSPGDPDWASRVLEAVEASRRLRIRRPGASGPPPGLASWDSDPPGPWRGISDRAR
jgi:hypothetical protein